MRGVDAGKSNIGFANSSTTVDGLEGNEALPEEGRPTCARSQLDPQYFQVAALADGQINGNRHTKGKTL